MSTNNQKLTLTAVDLSSSSSEVAFNESGLDKDFRVESNTSDKALFVDGGSSNVGINTNTPQYKFDTNSGVSNNFAGSIGSTFAEGAWSGIHFGYSELGNSSYRKSGIVFERQDDAARGKIHILNNGTSNAQSATLTDSKITIQYDGNVGIGTNNPITTLHVNGSTAVGNGAQALTLRPGSSNHVYIAWNPRTSAPSSRGAYAGFGGSGTDNFSIDNEIGNIDITAEEYIRFKSRWGNGNLTTYPAIPSNTSLYTHIKTTQHYTTAHMTMWKCEGYRSYSENVISTFGCYTYPSAPSAPYGMQIQRVHGGTEGFVNGYYSSDGYLVLVVQWGSTYTSFSLTHYATGGPYGGKGPTDIIAVTGSSSTTGAF